MLKSYEYETVTTGLKAALRNNDLYWFTKARNRFLCRSLMKYWAMLYSRNKDEKYSRGRKFLKRILKNSVNHEKWDIFYIENIFPYLS